MEVRGYQQEDRLYLQFSHRNNAPYKSPDLNFAVAELGSGGSANQPVSVLDPASNEGRQGRSMGLNTVEGDQNRCLDFTVRRPAIALDHSSGDDPRSVGFSMRRPATVPEHSSSGSPPKPAARADYSSSPVAYSQRVKEMSGPEKDHEVQWQEWRIEESATKVRAVDWARSTLVMKLGTNILFSYSNIFSLMLLDGFHFCMTIPTFNRLSRQTTFGDSYRAQNRTTTLSNV